MTLRRHLRDRLPESLMPAAIVLLEAMPMAPNGKVNRRALPAPDRSGSAQEKVFVGPRDDLESQLALIWEEILDVHPVGVTDNFFELGGHSLLAIRLFALIESRLGTRLPLTTVFQGATVEDLARVLRLQDMRRPSVTGGRTPAWWQQAAALPCTPGRRPCFSLPSSGTVSGKRSTLLWVAGQRPGRRTGSPHADRRHGSHVPPGCTIRAADGTVSSWRMVDGRRGRLRDGAATSCARTECGVAGHFRWSNSHPRRNFSGARSGSDRIG